MANIRLSTPAANAALNSLATLMDAGSGAATMDLYANTIPTNGDTAVGSQTKLGTVTFSNPCVAAPAASRVLTFDTITGDSSADASGTATWGRVKDSDGNLCFDGTVTATGGGGVITLNTTTIVAGGPITVTSGAIDYGTP